MEPLKKAARVLVDFIEVYLPVSVFLAMFVTFIINIFFRYVLKDPQNWTFELSVNSFVIVGLLGACAAYRKEDHVVFDLLYARVGARSQNLLRIISAALVIVVLVAALPAILRYLWKLPSMTSILRIPDKYIFLCFPILMVSTVCRSAYRLVLDIRSFRDKTYLQTYNTESKDALI